MSVIHFDVPWILSVANTAFIVYTNEQIKKKTRRK